MAADTGAPHHLPYNEQGDKPPNLEEVTKPLAEQTHKRLDEIGPGQILPPGGAADKGKLLLVDNTGAVAFQAMKGDVTIGSDGTTVIGKAKILTEMLADGLLTTVKYADKSVSLAKLVEALNLTDAYIAAANKDGAVGTPSLRTLGTGAKQAAAGNDSRLSDERTPKANSVDESKVADGAVSSRKFKPTTGVNLSTGLYTPEWEGKVSAAPIPGTTFEINPPVACKLIVQTMWNPRFNKVLATLQPHVHWTKGVSEKEFAVPPMPSHSAERDVNMPYSWTVEVPLTAGSNNAVDLRSYASVESAGKLTLPIGAAGYHYMLVAT